MYVPQFDREALHGFRQKSIRARCVCARALSSYTLDASSNMCVRQFDRLALMISIRNQHARAYLRVMVAPLGKTTRAKLHKL